MFCPKCGAEYRNGFTKCSDCKIPLVLSLPLQPKPEQEQKPKQEQRPKLQHVKLVDVFKTGNPATIAMVKSLLESAEIKYFVKNEGLQDLFVLGRLGIGFNPIIGPVEIWVKKEDEKDARKLLEELE